MFKALIILIFAAVVFGVGGYFAYDILVKPKKVAQQEVAAPAPPPPDPSLPEFAKVQKIAQAGELAEAQAAIENFIGGFPFSTKLEEAKALLGEVNADIFFSTAPSPDKQEYIVQRGDALAKIMRKFKTTPELIMRQNNLEDPTKLQIGQRLLISQPEFTMIIDRAKRVVTLYNHGRFFKEYTAKSWSAATKGGPVETTVSETIAWHNGERVAFGSKDFATGQRWITLATGGYTIFSEPDEPADPASVSQKPQGGIGLPEADAIELATLVRRGMPVKIQ
jgi:LysM repeat protein